MQEAWLCQCSSGKISSASWNGAALAAAPVDGQGRSVTATRQIQAKRRKGAVFIIDLSVLWSVLWDDSARPPRPLDASAKAWSSVSHTYAGAPNPSDHFPPPRN